MGNRAIVGEIKLWPGLTMPRDFIVCNGAEIPARRFPKLYNVIGNTYGGTPGETFKLPDLRDRVALGASTTNKLGAQSGQAFSEIDPSVFPQPSGTINATIPEEKISIAIPVSSASGGSTTPTGAYLGKPASATANLYAPAADGNTLKPFDVTVPAKDIQINLGEGGESAAQVVRASTMQPSVALNYIIAYDGSYPW